MPTNAKVAIELYVDDKGTLRVREFKKEAKDAFDDVEKSGKGAAGKIGEAWDKLKGAWVEITAGIMAMREAWDLANMAAKAKQEENSFASLAASYGANADSIIASLKRVSAGTVDTMTMIRSAGTAMMMGIAPDDVVKLMEIARATAKMTGQDTVTAFNDISLAVGRQSKMILDNLGIIIDVEKANSDYAAGLGKTAAQLTDVERKQAFMTATMKGGADLMSKLGQQYDTAADKLERWKVSATNGSMLVGKAILSLEMIAESAFSGIGATANKAYSILAKGPQTLLGVAANLPLVGGMFDKAASSVKAIGDNSEGASQIGLKHMKESWETMLSLWKSGEPVGGKVLKNLRDVKNEVAQINTEQQKMIDTLKKHQQAADDQAETEREMYEEAGFGAEKYFSQEATALVQKAARWKAAGADTYQTEQWLYEQLGKLSEDAWAKGETAAGQAMDTMQNMTETLIEQYTAANTSIFDQLTTVGLKVDELDGKNIGLTASFDGGMVVTGIDALITKFQALRAAASSAMAASSTTMTSSDSSLSISSSSSDQSSSSSTSTSTDIGAGNNAKSLIVNNFNQQISRSDVNSITSEQARSAGRK